MNLKSISLALIYILFVCFLINSCSADTVLSKGFIDGQIMIVGNEPFTKLAVYVDTNHSYILECTEKLKNKLWEKQGVYLRVYFDAHLQGPEGIKLVVNHIEYIKKSLR